ncbi:MAG: hypothetical protein ACLQGV_02545 [Bryobacteraceae bacterium]
MVDIGLSIVDRLIQLLTVRERNREKYFQEFIEPLYKDAEGIVNDYVVLFGELIELLKTADSTEEVVAWIEQRRLKMLPLRIKVRALLQNNTVDPDKVPEAYQLFVQGLWGVMKGGVSLVEDGHTPMREYGWGDHTVLDLLKIFSQMSPASRYRERYISNARRQLLAIETAWKDAANGYAVLKRESLRPA